MQDGDLPERKGLIELGDRRELFVDDYLIERPVRRRAAPEQTGAPQRGDRPRRAVGGQHQRLPHGVPGRQAVPRLLPRLPLRPVRQPLPAGRVLRREPGRHRVGTGRSWAWSTTRARPATTSSGTASARTTSLPSAIATPTAGRGRSTRPWGSALARTAEEQALYAFKSADGVHWSLLSEKPVITVGAFDSLNLAFYDPLRGCYVDYHRDSIHPGGRARAQHHDLHLEGLPPLDEAEMGSTSATRPSSTSTPTRLHPTTGPRTSTWDFPSASFQTAGMPGNTARGVSDAVYMTSRDGLHFKRWSEAFLRPGLQPERWENRNNMTAWGILETANDLPAGPEGAVDLHHRGLLPRRRLPAAALHPAPGRLRVRQRAAEGRRADHAALHFHGRPP